MILRSLFYAVFIVFVIVESTAQSDEKKSEGKFFGQWRSYYLGTFNDGDYKDFHGLATGGKLGYSYKLGSWKFQMVGYTTINLGVQDLSIPDEKSGRISRYELGLFDVNEPSKRWIGIPGEAFVSYSKSGHEVTAGRMKLITPLLNPQDGRMIPTLEQGIWYKYTSQKVWSIQTGLINAIAPRSTDRFVGIGESFGLYPTGRNLDGSPSGYVGNISADFLWVSNVLVPVNQHLKADIWNYYVDNVFNTTYSRLSWSVPDQALSLRGIWIHQQQINNGGNPMDSMAYFQDASSNLLGVEMAYNKGQSQFKVGYDHIPDGGRFIFPREWGRENLFTFQKRERTEGSANNHALLFTYQRQQKWEDLKVKSILSVGHQWKAELSNAADNKYALPSYRQINLDLFFNHTKASKWQTELLLVYKQGMGDIPDNPNFTINKVDFFQINWITNYTF